MSAERDDSSRNRRCPLTVDRGGRHQHGSQKEPRAAHGDEVNDQEPKSQAAPFSYKLLLSGGVLLRLRKCWDGGSVPIDPIVGRPILKTRERRINRRGPPVRADLSHVSACPEPTCRIVPFESLCRDSSLGYRLPRMEQCPCVVPLVPPPGEIPSPRRPAPARLRINFSCAFAWRGDPSVLIRGITPKGTLFRGFAVSSRPLPAHVTKVLQLNKGGITSSNAGHGWSLLSGQGSLASDCRCCGIAQLVADFGASRDVSEDDHDVAVISGSRVDEMVVIPRQHVVGLEDLPAAHRACVLATLRRLTRSIQERNPGSAARIVPLTDLPLSKGHVCFQVVTEDR